MPRRGVVAGESLVGIAARLVAERGVAGAHLQAVADAAGVSVGTVYNRFANKAALLAAVAEQVERDVVDVMAAAAPRTRPLRPALPELARAVLQTVLTSPASRVLADQDPAGGATTGHGRLVQAWIRDRVRVAQAAGEVGSVDRQLVAALAYALVLAAAREVRASDLEHGVRVPDGPDQHRRHPVEDVTALVGAALAALLPGPG